MAFLLALLLLPGAALAEDWPQAGGGPARTGARGVNVGVGNGTVLWEAQVGAGVEAPAVADGVAYVATGTFRDPALLHAFDVATGATRWRVGLAERGLVGAPVVAGDLAHVSFVDEDEEGEPVTHVRGLSRADGAEAWRATVPGRSQGTLAVYDATLFLTFRVGFDGNLHALDARTGEARWTVERIPGAAGAIAVADGVLLVQGMVSLHAFDPADGARRWTAREAGSRSNLAAPAIADGLAYWAGADGRLRALDLASGAPVWNASLADEPLESTPAVLDGRVYVGGAEGWLHALDARTGEEVWRVRSHDGARFGGAVHSYVAVTRDAAFLVEEDARQRIAVVAVDARNGTLAWTYRLNSTDGGRPVLADGRLLVVDERLASATDGDWRGRVVALAAGEVAPVEPPTRTDPHEETPGPGAALVAAALVGAAVALSLRGGAGTRRR